MSDDVCTGLQLVNFLQDPPAGLALGRIYLPLEDLRRFGVLEQEMAGPRSDRLVTLLRFESARAAALLDADCPSRQPSAGGGVAPSPCSHGAGSLLSLRSSAPGWDVFDGRPAPGKADLRLADAPRARPAVSVDAAYAECTRITRREARNFAWGIMLLPRPKRLALSALYAYARRVDDIADGSGVDGRAARGSWRPCGRPCAEPAPDARRRPSHARARRRGCSLPGAEASPARPSRRSALGRRPDALPHAGMSCASTAVALPARSGSRARRCTGRRSPSGLGLWRRRSASPCSRSTSCATSARTGRSGGCTCRSDELARFGFEEDDLAAGRQRPGWRALMAHQASRARALLAEGSGFAAARLRAAPFASGRWRASTSACSTRSSDGSTTSSRPDRACRRSASSV